MGLSGILPFLRQFAQQAQQPPPADLSQPPPMQAAGPSTPEQAPPPTMLDQQASQPQPAGQQMVTPPSPAPQQTKAHKLLQILQGGLVGGLSGLAANAQTYAQTGRNAGFGGGVGAGFTQSLPMQARMQQAELGGKQAQTGMLQSEQSPVQIPGYGPMPGWLAKQMGPAWIQAQARRDVQTAKGDTAETVQEAKSKTALDVQGKKSQTAVDVAKINQGQGIPLDPQVAEMAGMKEMANVPVGRGTLTNINKLIEAKGYRVQDMGKNGEDANSGMWLMDRGGNRIKQVSPNSITFQRGASFAQNRPETVVDPNDPGYAYYTTAAEAMSQHLPSPQGAGTVAAKTEARSEVPTKVGDLKVAYGTMIAHAQLLRQAAKALNNGDVQALAGLKNQFKNQFGYAGPITSEAIADAYKGEVSNVINKGHITDTGNEKVAHTLDPTHQNYKTLDSVLGAYESLAQSKQDQLVKQATAATTPKRTTNAAKPIRTIKF